MSKEWDEVFIAAVIHLHRTGGFFSNYDNANS